MHKNIIHRADAPGGAAQKLPCGRADGKDPDRCAEDHFFILLQIGRHRGERHSPAVHGKAAAPPEAEDPFRAFWGLEFKQVAAAFRSKLFCDLAYIPLAGKVDDERFHAACLSFRQRKKPVSASSRPKMKYDVDMKLNGKI